MLRRVNFFGICIASGLCLLLLLAGSRYTDSNSSNFSPGSIRNIRNFDKYNSMDETFPDVALEPTLYPEDTLTIEGLHKFILDESRWRIRSELAEHNFSAINGVNKLSDLVIENGGKPLRNIIVSTWRSGTTFLGEILNSVPGTFYHYEPLLNYDIIQIRGPPYSKTALKNLKKMLKCDYSDMNDYFEYGKTHQYLFRHNTRLWEHCKFKKELCFDPDFTGKFCSLFPFQIMKLVRLRLRLVEQLLEDPELNTKVILLIRDPRGVLQSRQHRDFCPPSPDCSQPSLLCADMVSDYTAATRLTKAYPDRFIVYRYEDLALDPAEASRKILAFLRIGYVPQVEEFVSTHTNVEVGGVSSTFRVSKEVPFKWKTILDYDYVSKIQGECKEAMRHWGYLPANNLTHLRSKYFYPITDYTL